MNNELNRKSIPIKIRYENKSRDEREQEEKSGIMDDTQKSDKIK